jgi:hypothetical protein
MLQISYHCQLRFIPISLRQDIFYASFGSTGISLVAYEKMKAKKEISQLPHL